MKLHKEIIFFIFSVFIYCPTAETVADSALFLSPYIKNGAIELARELSRVRGLPQAPDFIGYSGFFTVKPEYGSNMFFLFAPNTNGNINAPVIIWLQGGPGISALSGFFNEHGPYCLDSNATIGLRSHHWTKDFNVIYIDNPVAGGFSFTEDERGYITNSNDMAEDVCEFLQQFFTLLPEYRSNDFYVAGQSYGAKFAAALAFKIHTMPKLTGIKMKGIAFASAYFDIQMVLDLSTHELGLVDANQRDLMKQLEILVDYYFSIGKKHEAFETFGKILLSFPSVPYPTHFVNFTGLQYPSNFLLERAPEDQLYYLKYVESPEFRQAVHVGNRIFRTDYSFVTMKILDDFLHSEKDKLAVLMNNYKVLFYNGQLDLIIPHVEIEEFLNTLKWNYDEEYKSAKRIIWRLKGDDKIAGYVKVAKNVYDAMVLGAEHNLSYNQPESVLDLLFRFINGYDFN